jgi:hypothetical protein
VPSKVGPRHVIRTVPLYLLQAIPRVMEAGGDEAFAVSMYLVRPLGEVSWTLVMERSLRSSVLVVSQGRGADSRGEHVGEAMED